MADREFSDRRGDRNVCSVGPFERYPVMVNNWTVPNLKAAYRDDGSVSLTLDDRLSIDVPADLAGMVIEFVADATAIALGWSCFPTSPDWTPGPFTAVAPDARRHAWEKMNDRNWRVDMNSQPIRGRAGSYGGQTIEIEVDVPDTELHFERDERVAIVREDVLDALLNLAIDHAIRTLATGGPT